MVAPVHEGLRPLEGRARWAVIALIVVIVADVVAIGSDWLTINLMNDVLDGRSFTPSRLENDDLRQGVAGLLWLAAYIGAAVFFIRWFHPAYSNVRALGGELRFKGGWAIGAWFVPILNLWRPKQIANDIWRGSDPSVRSAHLHISKTSVTPLLGFWWGAWIIASFVSNAAGRKWWSSPTAEEAGTEALLGGIEPAFGSDDAAVELRRTAILDLAFSAVDIVAAILAILVVRLLTERQAERHRVVAGLSEEPQPAAT
jgi:hypothetical protein